MKVDAKVTDLDMTGLSKAKLMKFTGFQNQEIDMRFIIPAGGMYGPYKVKGKLLKLSIEGHGTMKITFGKFYNKNEFRANSNILVSNYHI